MNEKKIHKRIKRLPEIYSDLEVINVFLFIGLIVLIIGFVSGLSHYATYTAGKPAHLNNSFIGTEYTPQLASGDPRNREAAFMGFIIAGAGVIMCVGGLAIKYIKKNRR